MREDDEQEEHRIDCKKDMPKLVPTWRTIIKVENENVLGIAGTPNEKSRKVIFTAMM